MTNGLWFNDVFSIVEHYDDLEMAEYQRFLLRKKLSSQAMPHDFIPKPFNEPHEQAMKQKSL